MRIAVAGTLVLAFGCGDNNVPEPIDEEPRCAPEPGELPTTGPFIDPIALSPLGCVEGGLADLPGRWFVVDPTSKFNFSYPRFEGTCETGFRESFDQAEDHDDSDNQSYYTWTDGTRIYSRRYFRFESPPPEEQVFEFSTAQVLCMTEGGTLAGTFARLDFEGMTTMKDLTGTPFGPKDEPAAGLELVGEQVLRGPAEFPENFIVAYNVVVDGNHAYLVGPGGLDVVDVSDPTAPVAVGYFGGAWNDVRVVRTATQKFAIVAPLDGEETIVVDVTDPALPVPVHAIPEFSHSVQVQTVGAATHLYLATYGSTVPRYDVTNPLVPVRLGEAAIPGEPSGVHDLTVDGNRIYANYTDLGFVAFDVTAGLGAPVELGRMESSYSHASYVGTTTSGRRVILHGDEGMTGTPDGAAFLRILEGDPASPKYMTEIARYASRSQVGIHNIELHGNRVYLSYYQDGIRIVDIATPEQPTEVAHYNTWDPETALGNAFEGAVGIRRVNGLIYVADFSRGLIILREL